MDVRDATTDTVGISDVSSPSPHLSFDQDVPAGTGINNSTTIALYIHSITCSKQVDC